MLLIDEIDALVGDTLLSVLRQLRTGYVDRPARFPHSIILCGMRAPFRHSRTTFAGSGVNQAGQAGQSIASRVSEAIEQRVPMKAYIIRRLLLILPTLFILSIRCFIPGDVVDVRLPVVSTPPAYPRIPYGEADFRRIRRNRWLYVDKTRFLRRLEEERYAFLIRPRRFGKSLWISLLENYYDRFWADGFAATFAGTEIGVPRPQGRVLVGGHPTGEQSRYVTLRFNFSAVNDKLETLEREFETYCFIALRGTLHAAHAAAAGSRPGALSRPLVLLIDEIDALVGDTLLSVLRQLRTGYVDRPARFPHSIILCGMRAPFRHSRTTFAGSGVNQAGQAGQSIASRVSEAIESVLRLR